jgi:hypothetical protein
MGYETSMGSYALTEERTCRQIGETRWWKPLHSTDFAAQRRFVRKAQPCGESCASFAKHLRPATLLTRSATVWGDLRFVTKVSLRSWRILYFRRRHQKVSLQPDRAARRKHLGQKQGLEQRARSTAACAPRTDPNPRLHARARVHRTPIADPRSRSLVHGTEHRTRSCSLTASLRRSHASRVLSHRSAAQFPVTTELPAGRGEAPQPRPTQRPLVASAPSGSSNRKQLPGIAGPAVCTPRGARDSRALSPLLINPRSATSHSGRGERQDRAPAGSPGRRSARPPRRSAWVEPPSARAGATIRYSSPGRSQSGPGRGETPP